MSPLKDLHRFLREVNSPLVGRHVQNAEGAPSAKPSLSHLLEASETVDEVPFRILVGQVQQVDSTSGVGDIHCKVTNLPQAVRPLVHAE